jgi:hypothetical protein
MMDRDQLETIGYAIKGLPNLKSVPRMDFITPSGNILHGLPADAYHMQRYLSRGFKPIKVGTEKEISKGD